LFIHFPLRVQKGIILHRAIDTYTDTHPIVSKSSQRLFDTYSHYSRVIVDIYYDHFLAAKWENYSTIPLDVYVEDFYNLLQQKYDILPKRVRQFMPYMLKDNWLLSYASIEGIGKILWQMNHRTGKKSKMDLAVHDLEKNYSLFEAEFRVFFKDLEHYTHTYIHKL